MEAPNRKLIRPSLNELKERIEAKRSAPPQQQPKQQPPQQHTHAAQNHPPQQQQGGGGQQKKTNPPEETNAENFYYAKQIQMKTTMVLVLRDGEAVTGVIQWYDKSCFRIDREAEPAVLIYKENVKYMYKHE